ncbi:glycosyltransferase family 4 protein [Roseobacter sp. EG26]|uniref:glycosyltransferase family 4 protein n=1 Tax=Roseobacter sp. EG26 TaxID=3412477 RepID=UPI003CE57440
MGRALLKALDYGGVTAEVVSTLQTRDKAGDKEVQARLFEQADAEINRLIDQGLRTDWQVWVTYHSYYKAPDLVGPTVSAALNLPYVQIEATRARKRLKGPWAHFAQAAEAASDAAQVIFHLTERDAEALHAYGPSHQQIKHLCPFLPRVELPPASSGFGPMLSVGMLRHGDKFASYQLIADALKLLETPEWHLVIAGNGPALDAVASMMQEFGDRVDLRGSLDESDMQKLYSEASLLFWPGVNEAFGMTYLEAQAAALPVVAQRRPGVCDVLAPGVYPEPERGPEALARDLDALLGDSGARIARGQAARKYVADHHLMPAASRVLCQTIAELAP